MNRKATMSAGLVLLILIIGGASFLIGHQIALKDLAFKNVSPTQAAQAMKNDEFFSDYKENTLVIRGTISSVNKQGPSTIVRLKTNSTYQALCKLGNSSLGFKVGDAITVEAIGGNAVRQSSAVLLQHCISV